MNRRILFFMCLGLALSCAPRPGAGEFISVRVTWAPSVVAQCFVVRVTAEGLTPKTTKPMVRSREDERLLVAIFRDELPADVTLEALGFSDQGCITSTDETSGLVSASFTKKLSETGVELKVKEKAIEVGTDLDGDGSPTPEDCDDGNPAVRPGLPEACGDTFDNDCDDVSDCEDSECAGKVCGLGRACLGGFCGESACSNNTDDDADQLSDCADPDCAMQPCGIGGTCRVGRCLAPTEARCDDGDDNDGDGQTDCADSECNAQPCSDGDGCTSGETCAGTSCTGGTPRDCGAGLSVCLINKGCDAGVCLASARPVGFSCSNACTMAGMCDGDGGCSGTPVSCAPPPTACFGPGTCQLSLDGGCSYPVLLSGSCNDNDGCTTQDSCQGDGGCAGTRLDCSRPPECHVWSNTCSAGSCDFVTRSGAACDGGSCNSAGVCVPGGTPWPYVPSNFDPSLIPAADGGIVIDCTDLRIDTEQVPATVTALGCSSATVLPRPGTLVGNAMLFTANSFFLDAGARLTLLGTRPVIFAVSGDMTVAGELVATPLGGRPGAGAELDCTGATGTGGTAGMESGPGGSGGAFGSAGGAGGPGAGVGGISPAVTTPVGAPTLIPLRGGCAGGTAAGAQGGSKGRGGGAVQLSATGGISIIGLVGAPGEGGRGGQGGSAGGGGAGSGGAVLLEASVVQVTGTGRVLALGGGGGEGSATLAGNDGADGSRTDGVAAPGGNSGSAQGGRGGAGATRTTEAFDGGPGFVRGGGGGAGAGVGRVRINARCILATGSLISPAPSTPDGGCQ